MAQWYAIHRRLCNCLVYQHAYSTGFLFSEMWITCWARWLRSSEVSEFYGFHWMLNTWIGCRHLVLMIWAFQYALFSLSTDKNMVVPIKYYPCVALKWNNIHRSRSLFIILPLPQCFDKPWTQSCWYLNYHCQEAEKHFWVEWDRLLISELLF